MPFELIRNDITRMKTDAIVNAANRSLLGGGGVDGAIHRAAGPRLLEECRTLGGCETGEAKITGGYDLPAKYIIHTVGPVWNGGRSGEEALLRACYRNSLALAEANGCASLAFPLISAGVYGYPRADAIRIAKEEILAFLETHEMRVCLIIFDRESVTAGRALKDRLTSFIDDAYAETHLIRRRNLTEALPREKRVRSEKQLQEAVLCDACAAPLSLEERLNQLDESFSQMVLRKIDERGMTDVECYKRANLDRKLFSKLRGDVQYKPSKRTAMALCVALELPMVEARDLLSKAGFAFSHASKFDIIVEFFIREGNYDLQTINDALFDYDQPLLGA